MRLFKQIAVVLGIVAAIGLLAAWQTGYVSSQMLRLDSVGAQVTSVETCPTTKTITVSATTTEIVAVGAAKKIRVCSYVIARTDVAAVVATAKLVEGTGTNCATAQTNMTGILAAFPSATVGSVHFAPAPGNGLTSNVAGDAVCVTEAGAASSMDVTISYVQY